MEAKSSNSKYDAVIVGAGPAGCMAAANSPPGSRVLLLDRLSLPRDVICGGVLMPDVIDILTPYKVPDEIYCRPRQINWKLVDWRLGRAGRFSDKRYLNIYRHAFDRWLLEIASSTKNVSVWTKSQLLALDDGESSGLRLLIKRGSETVFVETDFLIGADGAGSQTRKFLGEPISHHWNTIQETIISEGARVRNFLAFMSGDIDFYGWVIPKNDELVIGAAYSSANGKLTERFRGFQQLLKEHHQIYGKTSIRLRSRKATRLKSLGETSPGQGNIFFTGEAAGLLSPWNGEGISYALLSGAYAGKALGMPNPRKYYHHHFRRILPDIAINLFCRKAMKLSFAPLLAAHALRRADFKRIEAHGDIY